MLTPARIDIHADRWVACIRSFAFVGYDFTGATFAAHVRTLPDAPGAPLVALGTVASAAAQGIRLVSAAEDTIANHITAGRLNKVPSGYSESSTVWVSLVGLRINEATMENLPFPDDTGDNITFAWDLHITPAGAIKDKYMGGDFGVRSGVTQ